MIKAGIFGYGNLARGVEAAIKNSTDITLCAVFTKREPDTVKIRTEGVPVYKSDRIFEFKDEIDVLINCGGSARDLPITTPFLAEHFNVIDSFDNHAKIPEHFKNVNEKSLAGNKISVISVGWDPGMFSLNRAYMNAVLPNGNDYTFWGRGVSQGHSDAVRRIDGVIDARQYTVPVESSVNKVRNGENPVLTVREKHKRECYVVAEEGADKAKIEKEIKSMPDYFEPYDTTVYFIDEEEMAKNHSALPHGGSVIRTGFNGYNNENKSTIEYSLKLDSNPEFTGSVLVAYARAAVKLNNEGIHGCKTVFDIPVSYMLDMDKDYVISHLL